MSVAYTLPQLLANYGDQQLQDWLDVAPWRRKRSVTEGRIQLGLQMIFSNVRVREWWNPKYRKFEPPLQSAN
ncbi:hypothetical protein [Desulfopila sp. IMCC35008]|uniref:hypothetical protein n=1 Tax=Desulfopila sp. IMCC35008 TaxID=2653858 RepID=UPI0013D6B671|nr:hypothetical protein [Desulfopila sp. IMCC35008]